MKFFLSTTCKHVYPKSVLLRESEMLQAYHPCEAQISYDHEMTALQMDIL